MAYGWMLRKVQLLIVLGNLDHELHASWITDCPAPTILSQCLPGHVVEQQVERVWKCMLELSIFIRFLGSCSASCLLERHSLAVSPNLW